MTPEEIVDRLTKYDEDHAEPSVTRPNNIWEDVIYRLPGFDGEATEGLYSDRFVADGVIYWHDNRDGWLSE